MASFPLPSAPDSSDSEFRQFAETGLAALKQLRNTLGTHITALKNVLPKTNLEALADASALVTLADKLKNPLLMMERAMNTETGGTAAAFYKNATDCAYPLQDINMVLDRLDQHIAYENERVRSAATNGELRDQMKRANTWMQEAQQRSGLKAPLSSGLMGGVA